MDVVGKPITTIEGFAVQAGKPHPVVEAFVNNDEGAFVRAFDRLFDMYGKGLSLPANYAGGENIDDALIA